MRCCFGFVSHYLLCLFPLRWTAKLNKFGVIDVLPEVDDFRIVDAGFRGLRKMGRLAAAEDIEVWEVQT